MSVFSKTVFRESAAEIEKLPADGGREVAFVGRSNAGKSSTINALTGIGRLAFVSKQPGRTQLINLFEVIPVGSTTTLKVIKDGIIDIPLPCFPFGDMHIGSW